MGRWRRVSCPKPVLLSFMKNPSTSVGLGRDLALSASLATGGQPRQRRLPRPKLQARCRQRPPCGSRQLRQAHRHAVGGRRERCGRAQFLHRRAGSAHRHLCFCVAENGHRLGRSESRKQRPLLLGVFERKLQHHFGVRSGPGARAGQLGSGGFGVQPQAFAGSALDWRTHEPGSTWASWRQPRVS